MGSRVKLFLSSALVACLFSGVFSYQRALAADAKYLTIVIEEGAVCSGGLHAARYSITSEPNKGSLVWSETSEAYCYPGNNWILTLGKSRSLDEVDSSQQLYLNVDVKLGKKLKRLWTGYPLEGAAYAHHAVQAAGGDFVVTINGASSTTDVSSAFPLTTFNIVISEWGTTDGFQVRNLSVQLTTPHFTARRNAPAGGKNPSSRWQQAAAIV